VWEFGKGRQRRRLTLKKSLFGHAEAVTCLTASAAYNIIVSGSRDRTCIIWDLNELVFVRQLRGHAAPVAAVTVNELTVSRLLFCYSTTTNTHTHTHTRLTALCPGLPGWAGTRKAKPIWILLEQEIVSGSGISWAICVSTSLQTDNHASTPLLSFL